uniref:1-Cys peroxiredoxin n=1 Tax=Lepeophtheirus salmonis TaxID=72036 RepID=D3PGM2_LEPSM|nr:Peroxiredoxin-6 [Lepeophtheirus salmonis]
MPALVLGSIAPDFRTESSEGPIEFHEYIKDSWAILFSHPADYTPVCTTELGAVEKYADKFKERGVKLLALSCDSAESHKGWIDDIKAYNSISTFSYPILADEKREIAELYGMLDPEEKDSAGVPLTARAVFIIGPDKKLKLSILYPTTTGRNFDEIIRVLDSLKLTAEKKVATPVNWTQGSDCMVIPSISEEEAKKLFPEHKSHEVPSGKNYLRTTPHPK